MFLKNRFSAEVEYLVEGNQFYARITQKKGEESFHQWILISNTPESEQLPKETLEQMRIDAIQTGKVMYNVR